MPVIINGISLFLVDRTAAGVEVERSEMVDSRNYANINFNNVEVTETALLGEEGSGFPALSATLDAGNAFLAAEMLGIAQQTFDVTLQYLKRAQTVWCAYRFISGTTASRGPLVE